MTDNKNIKNTNVILFGKNGQIGSNLSAALSNEEGVNVASYSSQDVNFSNLDELSNFLKNLSIIPDFIINAAAYTAVDKAEEEKELANLINHKAVAILAQYSAQNNIKLIHYSTDYVFDGSGNAPFKEDNIKNLIPLNFYGKTKLLGEKAIVSSGCDYLILRTSWIYDEKGKNFANTITKLAVEKDVLTIVSDQIGGPTSAKFVAQYTLKIIKKLINWKENFPSGIYDLANTNYVSWYEFALQIIDSLRKKGVTLKVKEVKPIFTSEYKTMAIRPLNSRLNTDKIQNIFGVF